MLEPVLRTQPVKMWLLPKCYNFKPISLRSPFCNGSRLALGEGAVDPCSSGHAETRSWTLRELVLITLVFSSSLCFIDTPTVEKVKNAWH